LFFVPIYNVQAQQKTITGKVVDSETEKPITGVTVMEKGTQTGTITDADGDYSVTVSSEEAVLVFSFVGYETQEVPVEGKTTINISLTQKAIGLDEVVVIGYGTVRKSDLTGSVTQVRGEDLAAVPSSNPLDALQGKVSGVQISSTSGEPGSDPTVRVRGVGSLNSGVDPIYVVDGVIVEDISFLNTSDIYSIEVLKDASATAIYGSRGANGVFIITTKMGGVNTDPVVSFQTEQSVQTLQKKIDLLDGQEFARALNDINPGTINNISAVPDVDWQDLIYRDNPRMQSYDLSVSGGMEKLGYYLGLGHIYEKGLIPKSDLKRYTVKLNTDYQAKDYLRFGTNISLAYRDKENAPGVVNAAYKAWPITEPYDDQGEFQEVTPSNPLASLAYTNNFTKAFRTVGNVFGEINFLENFKFKSSYQVDYEYRKNRNFTPVFIVSAVQKNERSSLSLNQIEDRTWIWENTLNYSNEIGKHRIDAVAGYTAQNSYLENGSASVYELLREEEEFWYLNGTTKPDSVDVSGSAREISLLSYLFRTNYSYNDKYLVTVSMRADGSSKFSEELNNRWGFFPSFAVGYNISKEPFFPQLPFLDNLKLRYSYGVIGNENILWRSRFSLIRSDRGAVFGKDETLQGGATFGEAGNDNLIWESTYSSDIGIEVRAFNNRLNAEFDYYDKKTRDILVQLTPPLYYGYGSFQRVYFNAADVQNRGIELNLGWKHKVGNWNYGINAQFTTVHNEVLEMGATNPSDSTIRSGNLGTGEQVTQTTVGKPIGAFYGYEIVGIFQDEQDLEKYPTRTGQGVGDLIYRDANGDGRINADDKVMIGSPIPDFIFGFGLRFGYKDLITVSMDFQGQYGNEIYNGKNETRFTIYNFEGRVRDRWTPSNPSNTEPRLNYLAGNYESSEYFLEDGSYLRLRNLKVNFNLPDKWLNWANLQSASIYFRGTNLFTLTDYSGYSPDIGGNNPLGTGIDLGVYPIATIYTLGINVSL
jgi:TonB-linked SusC/RagA family outer membrane protein